MKRKSTKTEGNIKWIGESYDETSEDANKLFNVSFYRKCALNNLTIKQNDIVCIANVHADDPESYEECEVMKVKYLFQDTTTKSGKCYVQGQWYFRPSNLDKQLRKDPLYAELDKERELIIDEQYKTEKIEIGDVFDIAFVYESREAFQALKKPKASFFCRHKVVGTGRKRSLARLASAELKIVLKKLPDDIGSWSVLKQIPEDSVSALNSIENLNLRTPKSLNADCKTPRSCRLKPTTYDEDYEFSPPKKSRLSAMKVENTTPKTPKPIQRRKSILKTPSTPKNNTPRRSIKFSDRIQIQEELEEDKSNLAIARKRLHVSAVPKTLPCREREFEEIYSFLEGNLADGIGGCIYISGVPGTGKTATTTAVIKALQAESNQDNLPSFDYVEINGMRVTEPRKAYVEIYRQLYGKTLPWEQAYDKLDKRFTTPSARGKTTILVVDELDILCNKRQDVVYNLLNWPNLNGSRLIVVTIANTMDLPERVFIGRVASRLGLTRLTFQPYTFRQLQEIVSSRLSGLDAFTSDGIQLVSRKVAALSGDARRALDICRRASEIAEAASKDKKASVSMEHIEQALGEMISSTRVRVIKSCSKMEKFFLQAVCMEVERTGIEEVLFRGVYNQLKIITALNGIRLPEPSVALQISSQLGSSRLLIAEHTRNGIYQKILLNISPDDFYYATQLRNE